MVGGAERMRTQLASAFHTAMPDARTRWARLDASTPAGATVKIDVAYHFTFAGRGGSGQVRLSWLDGQCTRVLKVVMGDRAADGTREAAAHVVADHLTSTPVWARWHLPRVMFPGVATGTSRLALTLETGRVEVAATLRRERATARAGGDR